MKLYNFLLLILSFACTLSGALPAGNNQCAPVNEDGAALRNTNGAGISLFSNQIRINIVQAYYAPTQRYPWGGFVVSIINDYCLYIEVTFRLPDGRSYTQRVSPRSSVLDALIPRGVQQGAIIHVSVHDYL
jgi:hypothetical protein